MGILYSDRTPQLGRELPEVGLQGEIWLNMLELC